jgi:hypothetical protein
MSSADWFSLLPGKKMTIYASKLAACAGRHPFQHRDVLKGTFLRAVGKAEYETPLEKGLAEVMNDADLKVFVETKFKDASELTASIDALGGNLTDSTKAAVQSLIYTKHGNDQESSIRNRCDAREKVVTVLNSRFHVTREPMFYVKCPESSLDIPVYVGGKHDGTRETELVEIKTRMRKYLGTPEYELIQLHAYMKIYEFTKGKLIESFNGEERVHDVPFDDDFWSGVVADVEAFVNELLILL